MTTIHSRVASALVLVAFAGHAMAVGPTPVAPSSLSVTPASGGRVVLAWNDNSDNETGFRIDREPAGEGWPVIVGANQTTYSDRPGIGAFTYRVTAVADGSASEPSAPVTARVKTVSRAGRSGGKQVADNASAATPGVAPATSSATPAPSTSQGELRTTSTSVPTAALPTAPVKFEASPALGAVYLSWRDNSGLASGFEIARETFSGPNWINPQLTALNAEQTEFVDRVTSGLYRYRVRSTNANGASSFTPWVIAAFADGPKQSPGDVPPAPPEGVSVTDIGNGRAMVTWRDMSTSEDGFTVERDPAFPAGAIGLAANATAYVDASGNGTFRYRVRSFNGFGPSEFSSWMSGTVSSAGASNPPSGASSGATSGSSSGTTSGGSAGGSTGGGGSGGGGTGGGTSGGGTSGGGGTGGGGSGSGSTGGGSTGGGTSGGSGTTVPYGGGELIPGLPIDADGWTVFSPSTDTRIVYVSSSIGNDSNTGLSPEAPKRTLAAARSLMRTGKPDWMLLKRGDTFRERIRWGESGRSYTEPAVLGAYGDGARPQIVTQSATAFYVMEPNPVNHVAVVGIHFRDETWNGTGDFPNGMDIISRGEDFLLEDCKFEGYANNVSIQGWQGDRVNTKIRRNLLLDGFRPNPNIGGTNLYTAAFDGMLVEENVFDFRPELEAQGKYISHNYYMLENSSSRNIVRRNIARDGGRTNFSIRSGGIVENNLSLRAAMHFSAGIGYATVYPTVTFRDNVIMESRNNSNGQGLGIGFWLQKVERAEVVGNLILNNTDGTDPRAVASSSNVRNLLVENNIVYNWAPAPSVPALANTFEIDPTGQGMVTIRNNDVQIDGLAFVLTITGTGWPIQQRLAMSNNRYRSGWDPARWFDNYGDRTGVAGWSLVCGDTTSRAENVSYPDPTRNVARFVNSVTQADNGSIDQYMSMLREQSKRNWRPDLSAAAVNAYLRQGFGR